MQIFVQGNKGLSGPPGDKGTVGDMGGMGDDGQKGDKGMKGLVGDIGDKGQKVRGNSDPCQGSPGLVSTSTTPKGKRSRILLYFCLCSYIIIVRWEVHD